MVVVVAEAEAAAVVARRDALCLGLDNFARTHLLAVVGRLGWCNKFTFHRQNLLHCVAR